MNFGKKLLKKEVFHLTLEILLIFAAVLIFRSAWELLDSYQIFKTKVSLIIMLIIGIVITAISTKFLFSHEKYH
ncbi:MAG: hypothetical protein QXI33_00850 [Candidatus Pacearchaeota archaeon]